MLRPDLRRLVGSVGHLPRHRGGVNGSAPAHRIAVHVVLYDSSEHVPRLLRALDHLDIGAHRIVVRFLNNTPGDGCAELIAAPGCRHPVEYHDSEQGNIGFGAGHNRLAAFATDADYILLLNPDTIPFDDLILRLVEVADRAPTIAMVEAAQFPVEHPKAYIPDTGATNWCCAACLLLRAPVFRQLGGFDEKLFLYCEDVDLSWRSWLAGYTCVYAPLAKCVHVSQEEDIGKNRGAEIHHMHLGGLYLRRKWFGDAEVWRYREHLRVWFGEAFESRLVAAVDALEPVSCDRRDHPRITLMPDQIHYAPIRW